MNKQLSISGLSKQEYITRRCQERDVVVIGPRAPMSDMPSSINECWTMDFVSDQLYNGKKFLALTLLDIYIRECLDIYADQKTEKVTEVLYKLKETRGLPKRIKVDNGPKYQAFAGF